MGDYEIVWGKQETPPNDDVCPICFDDFTIACRTNCGHWYCGSCILLLWNHGSLFQPCKCPMCCCCIRTLTPEASVHLENVAGTTDVLKAVAKYNSLFTGGTLGFFLKFHETPRLIGRMVGRLAREMIDPDRAHAHVSTWRDLLMILILLIMASPFNFIPQGVNLFLTCHVAASLLVFSLMLVGWLRRRRVAQRAHQIAAAEALLNQ